MLRVLEEVAFNNHKDYKETEIIAMCSAFRSFEYLKFCICFVFKPLSSIVESILCIAFKAEEQ